MDTTKPGEGRNKTDKIKLKPDTGARLAEGWHLKCGRARGPPSVGRGKKQPEGFQDELLRRGWGKWFAVGTRAPVGPASAFAKRQERREFWKSREKVGGNCNIIPQPERNKTRRRASRPEKEGQPKEI